MEDQRPEDGFEEIVGDSPALKRMLKLAIKVARSHAPVLILGEAGSGKELIARAIHRISARRNESFVKVNCVQALSAAGTLESDLFGQENAAQDESRKIGHVELANQGHSSWMRSHISRWTLGLGCLGCWSAGKLNDRVVRKAFRWMYG